MCGRRNHALINHNFIIPTWSQKCVTKCEMYYVIQWMFPYHICMHMYTNQLSIIVSIMWNLSIMNSILCTPVYCDKVCMARSTRYCVFSLMYTNQLSTIVRRTMCIATTIYIICTQINCQSLCHDVRIYLSYMRYDVHKSIVTNCVINRVNDNDYHYHRGRGPGSLATPLRLRGILKTNQAN